MTEGKMKKLISDYLRKRRERNIKNQIESLISDETFIKTVNSVLKNARTVAFVTSHIAAHAGGMTSILRLGTVLEEEGFQVSYIALGKQSQDEIEQNAKIDLQYYKGTVKTADHAFAEHYDVVIATDWKSVYSARKMNGYKMYFVQDYEPYFCEDGERFILAKKTYELGLHMVSLGQWNKSEIERNTDDAVRIDYIDFPYEASEYHMVRRNYDAYPKRKTFRLVVYLKQAGRRLPTVIPIMLSRTKELFKEKGIDLQIQFFGGIEGIDAGLGENLGKLSKAELMTLYGEADFGMVSSMTNISLVPYEMLATGLPLIEFQDGTFPFFFEKPSAILTSFSAQDLFEKMYQAIHRPEILREMNENARECMKGLSWKNSGHQFAEIIRKVCRDDS